MPISRTETEDGWGRFLRGAAYVHGNPRFEVEERGRKLDLARRLRSLMEAAAREEEFRTDLDSLLFSLRDPSWPCPVILPAHAYWLQVWAYSDQASLREALARFSMPEVDPVLTFARFAQAAEEAHKGAAIEPQRGMFLMFGSLFNFALDPPSLPIIRPRCLDRIEQRLGWDRRAGSALAERYENHLAFAREVEAEMRSAGIPIRDMLDVQSLIVMASEREDYWASELEHFQKSSPAKGRPRRSGQKSTVPYLSVGACLGFDAPYLLEWIEFHRLVGVEHFFLYNNGDIEAQRDLLQPYVDETIVTLYEWPVSPPQAPAFRHCVENHREDSRWIAFIDTDEFLFSPAAHSLPEVLIDYETWPGVGVNWAMFGPSGHRSKPAGLVIENYVWRSSDSGLGVYGRNHIKNIVDPMRVVDCRSPHYFTYKDGFAVDENQYPILDGATTYVSTSRLQLNHYFTRSVSEFYAKLNHPRPDSRGSPRPVPDVEQMLMDEKTYGVQDSAILKYVPALRQALTGQRPGLGVDQAER